MKKILLVAAAVLASAILVTGCGSTATVAKTELSQEKKPVHDDGDGVGTVIDWYGKDIGEPQNPDWLSKAFRKSWKDLPLANGKAMLLISDRDESLDGVRIAVETRAAQEFARRNILAVTDEAGTKTDGNKSIAESMKNIVHEINGLASLATFSGLEQLGVHWTRERMSSGRLVYNYYVLYGMNSDIYEKQISQWLDDNANAKSEEDKAAIAEIKKSIKASAKKAGFVGFDD